jgi:hypothetical protein
MFLNFGNDSNSQNWLMALATILAIAGIPFIENEMNHSVQGFFKNALVKKLVVFSSVFLNTKDFYISLFTTIMYTIVFDIILGKPLEKENNKR